MKVGYIYKITNPLGQIYIGQAENYKSRWKHYKRLDCKQQKLIYESLVTSGYDNHKFEVILKVNNIEYLDIIETFFIEFFNSYYYENRKYGLNMLKYGKTPMRGRKHTNESKQKMSRSRTGQFLSEEYRKKLSDIIKNGKNNFIYSKFQPEPIIKEDKTKSKYELKLNKELVLLIVNYINQGVSAYKISKIIGVDKAMILNIRHGRNWVHITKGLIIEDNINKVRKTILTENQKLIIKQEYLEQLYNIRQLSERYSCCKQVISNIINTK